MEEKIINTTEEVMEEAVTANIDSSNSNYNIGYFVGGIVLGVTTTIGAKFLKKVWSNYKAKRSEKVYAINSDDFEDEDNCEDSITEIKNE